MIKLIHSYWAYLTLIILAIAAINAIIGFLSKRDYVSKDLRIGLFALIVSHIQFLLGILLYFTSPLFALWSASGVQAIMQDRYSRKMLVEHPLMILIAVTLITIGWSLHKKQKTSQRAFGKIAFFYTLALLFILFVIPWNVWI